MTSKVAIRYIYRIAKNRGKMLENLFGLLKRSGILREIVREIFSPGHPFENRVFKGSITILRQDVYLRS